MILGPLPTPPLIHISSSKLFRLSPTPHPNKYLLHLWYWFLDWTHMKWWKWLYYNDNEKFISNHIYKGNVHSHDYVQWYFMAIGIFKACCYGLKLPWSGLSTSLYAKSAFTTYNATLETPHIREQENDFKMTNFSLSKEECARQES